MSVKLLKVRNLVRKHEGFSEAAIRWHIHNADRNGLDFALKRMGRAIFIDEELFLAWLESKQSKTKPN